MVGKIGDDLRMDYTAIGDTTNLAARLQSLAQPSSILTSSYTYRLARTSLPRIFREIREGQGGTPASVPAPRPPPEVATRIAAATAKGLTRFIGRTRELQSLRRPTSKSNPAPARWWGSWARRGWESPVSSGDSVPPSQEDLSTWKAAASTTGVPWPICRSWTSFAPTSRSRRETGRFPSSGRSRESPLSRCFPPAYPSPSPGAALPQGGR